MKRVNHLLEKMTCPDNLRLAFWKAKKGKATSQQVLRYRQRLDTNLRELRHQILLGEVNVGEYFYFKIYDPKEREICASAFSEQVLHHALMNVCHPYFDRVHIFDSYASRPGKGVHLAVKRAAKYTRQWPWYLKMDIRQFFASIDHSILKGQLARLFKEHKLLGIFDQIIDSYHRLGTKGLPIGNLSSQYFANHYLTTLDHHIKEVWKAKAYVRYMDDLVIWSGDKATLKRLNASIEEYVQTRLALELKPSILNRSHRGLTFCGYRLFPYRVGLSKRSAKRYLQKMMDLDQQYLNGEWEESACQRKAQSLVAFTEHADALGFRKKVWARLPSNQRKII